MRSPERYLPSESLVAATLDGSALTYLPSPSLVSRVLAGNRRPRARFRIPPELFAPEWSFEARVTPKRAAGLTFAALGLSPSALAAATVMHLALFATTGWLVGRNVAGIRGGLTAPAVAPPVEEHLVYVSDWVERARVARLAARVQSAPRVAPEPRRPVQRAGEPRGQDRFADPAFRSELENAIRAEFVIEGEGASVTAASRQRIEQIASLMRRIDGFTIVVQSQAPPAGAEVARVGQRDGETVARELVRLGVPESRITVRRDGPIPAGCATITCIAERRVVHILFGEVQPPKSP